MCRCREAQAGIVPTIPLHSRHPWRSDVRERPSLKPQIFNSPIPRKHTHLRLTAHQTSVNFNNVDARRPAATFSIRDVAFQSAEVIRRGLPRRSATPLDDWESTMTSHNRVQCLMLIEGELPGRISCGSELAMSRRAFNRAPNDCALATAERISRRRAMARTIGPPRSRNTFSN